MTFLLVRWCRKYLLEAAQIAIPLRETFLAAAFYVDDSLFSLERRKERGQNDEKGLNIPETKTQSEERFIKEEEI